MHLHPTMHCANISLQCGCDIATVQQKTAKSDRSVAKYHRFEYLCNRLFEWQSSGGWVTSLQVSNLKLSNKLL